MKPKSIRSLRKRSRRMLGLRQPEELAVLLQTPAYQLQLMALKPVYNLFSVPKKDGSRRWIEDPARPLKKVQRRLNAYLQSVYFFICPSAAYGFMITAKGDRQPRNILTNAEQHLGCSWLYNADIADFFHQISFERTLQLFGQPPFSYEEDLARLLARLTTFRGRLPMGAPSSPVLSNFACLQLDAQLTALADWAEWTYTRFADDMSFSAHQPMEEENLRKIAAIVETHGFRFNPAKVKLYGPEEVKYVTGLRLEEQVKLPPGYAAELKREITKLGHVLEVQQRSGRQSKWVERFQQQVEGMLNFAAFILGDSHPVVVESEAQLEQALQPSDTFSSLSWTAFNYV